MSDVSAARASMERAQSRLDEVTGDLARFDDVLAWLADADARVRALQEYAQTQGPADLDAVLATDPLAVTPPVVNEDAIWEAVVDFDDRVRHLLRFVTASLTASLDESPLGEASA